VKSSSSSGGGSRDIEWETLDVDSARTTIRAGGQSGSATFIFDADGRPNEFRADRFNDAKKQVLPFVNVNHTFGECHGIRIPTQGEALWKCDTGDFPYIRGASRRLTSTSRPTSSAT
jgi:hypothetical protein